jgi:hypothetical protein
MLAPPKFIFKDGILLASVTTELVSLVVLLFTPKAIALAAFPDTTVSGVIVISAPDKVPPPKICNLLFASK